MNKKLNESMELEQNLVAKGYPQIQVILMELALHFIVQSYTLTLIKLTLLRTALGFFSRECPPYHFFSLCYIL